MGEVWPNGREEREGWRGDPGEGMCQEGKGLRRGGQLFFVFFLILKRKKKISKSYPFASPQ